MQSMDTVVETAVTRIVDTYSMMFSAAEAEQRRDEVTKYVDRLFWTGQEDTNRLVVEGLTYLRNRYH